MDYKVWDELREVYGTLVSIDLDKKLVGFDAGGQLWFAALEKCQLLQFTGKQDADGNKIYAGDILDYFSLTKIVGWDNENSMWAFKRSLDEKSKYVQQLATVDLQKSHIVGNVYQNPERIAKL